MKLTKQVKIISLIGMLAVIIVGGSIALLYSNRHPKNEKEPSESVQSGGIGLSNQEQELRYQEEVALEAPWEGNLTGRLVGESRPISYSNGKLIDLSSGEEISQFIPPASQPLALYVRDDLSYSIIYQESSSSILYSEYGKDGSQIGDALKLFDSVENNDWRPNVSIKQFQDTSEYIIILTTDESLRIYNKIDGKLYLNYDFVRGFDLSKKGSLFICSGTFSSMRTIYREVDLSSGTVEHQLEKQDWVPAGVQFTENNQKLYFLTFSEIRVLSSDTLSWVTDSIIIARDTSVANPWDQRGYFIGEDGSIYISTGVEGEKCTIFRYILKPYNAPKPVITLTLTSPYRDNFIEEAILRYQRIHPEVYIQYDYEYNTKKEYLRVYGKVSYGGDYAERLALKLMTGEAGDIVQTGGSGLAYRELFSTDVFMDLKKHLIEDKSYNKLNHEAIEALTIQGAIRGIPISTSNIFIEINQELWDTLDLDFDYNDMSWSKVISIFNIWKEKYPDRPFISVPANGAGRNLHIKSFLVVNMPDLIDLEQKKVDLKQSWFMNILQEWKSALQNPMFIKPFSNNTSYINWLKRGIFRQGISDEGQYLDIVSWYGDFNKVDGIDTFYIPMFRGEKNRNYIAYSSDLYSISNTSEHKEEAWKFLSFLVSSEAQSFVSFAGNNINLEARELKFDSILKECPEYGQKTSDCLNSLRKLQAEIDYLYDMDYYVTHLMAPLLEYFDDKLTLEEALTKAEESIWVRINE